MRLKLKLNKLAIFVLIGTILFPIVFLISYLTTLHLKTTPKLKLATEIFQKCQNNPFPQGCYEKTVPLLMDSPTHLSMTQAFEVVDLIKKLDPKYNYCHVAGHFIGQKQVLKNPNKWKEAITMCPMNGGCANGCIHGILMERFKTETFTDAQISEITSEMRSMCNSSTEWKLTKMESIGCFHAMGHAAMYLTNADINKSLEFCYDIGKQNNNDLTFYYNCYQGIFMQIIQPLEAEDKALVKQLQPKTATEAMKFCDTFTDSKKAACQVQTWPLFFESYKDPKKMSDYCRHFDYQYQDACYSTVINTLTGLVFDSDFIIDYCSQLTTPSPGECLGRSARRILQIDIKNFDKSINLCQQGSQFDPKGNCFYWLISTDSYILKDPTSERESFCKRFPAPWQEQCLKK